MKECLKLLQNTCAIQKTSSRSKPTCGRYHLDDANDFYEAAGAWVVSLDPGDDLDNAPTAIITESGFVTFASGKRMDPYYVQMQLPGETSQEFVLLRPFVPRSSDDS